MGNRSDGGGLGGKRGGDCGRDLGLQGRGGFCVSHPKRNGKKCGLELAQAAATMTTKTMSNCGWSGLNNNTAKKRRQKKQQRETIVEFSKKKLFENEEYGETVAGVISTTTQGRETAKKRRPKKQQRERASNRLEMFLVSICV
jgi:hypothetical protein